MVTKGEVEVDIGCGNEFGGGAEEDGGAGPTGEVVNDLIDAFQYNESPFTKAEYMTYIKEYMKKVKAILEKENPSRVDGFMKGAQEMVKFILSRFNDFTFYTASDYDNENIIILSYYKQDSDPAPTFLYFMDGLKRTKF